LGGHRRRIIWSSEALADLDGIWDYYEQTAGGYAAESIVRRVFQTCAVLEEHAFAGLSRDEVRQGLRSFVTPPYVVFYRVQDDDVPEIVRVVDERQDIEATL